MEEKDGKDVVDTENFEGEHISTFVLTSHKHGMPKLVLLHSYDQNCHTSPTWSLSNFTNLIMQNLYYFIYLSW